MKHITTILLVGTAAMLMNACGSGGTTSTTQTPVSSDVEPVISNVEQIAKLQGKFGSWDDFGQSISVSGDIITVGAPMDFDKASEAGSAYLFEKQDDGNVTQLVKLYASDAEELDHFGHSVAVSGDLIVVGVPDNDDNGIYSGVAYLFQKQDDGNVTQLAKLYASDAEELDHFGHSVAISGDLILISSRGLDHEGSVHLFQKQIDGNVMQLATLYDPNPTTNGNFGIEIAISGDMIVIISHDKTGDSSARMHVFKKQDDGNVTQLVELGTGAGINTPSVAISGDLIVVGKTGDGEFLLEDNAYLFEKQDDGNVTQLVKFYPSDAKEYEIFERTVDFGKSVAISGDLIVVGAPEDDDLADRTGAVYLFEKQDDGNVTQLVKFYASDAKSVDRFGTRVAISEDLITVGNERADDFNPDRTVYVYEIQ